MEYYPKVKSLKQSLKPAQYALYKELRALSIGYGNKDYDLYFKWREQFETIKNKAVREDLLEVVDHLNNYGTDLSFEISPRNVAVKNGKLILLDCFFIASQAAAKRKNKKNKYQYY